MGATFSKQKKTEKDPEKGSPPAAEGGGDGKGKAGEKVTLTAIAGQEIKAHIVDFFGNKPVEKKEKDAALPSWRNTTVTFLSFLVFFYCFIIQIWVITRIAQAGSQKSDNASVSSRSNATDSSSTSPLSSIATATTKRKTAHTTNTPDDDGEDADTTSSKARAKTTKAASTRKKCGDEADDCEDADSGDVGYWLNERRKRRRSIYVSYAAATTSQPHHLTTNRPLDPAPTFNPLAVATKVNKRIHDAVTSSPQPTQSTALVTSSLVRRALSASSSAGDIAGKCLYVEGSELAKHGDLAVALNVIYNLWVMIFILLLLSYERKRLRLQRRAHSATVIAFIQMWMATDYLSKGVEVQLLIAALAVYMIALFNFMFGLGTTIKRREDLFPYLLGRVNLDRRGPDAKGKYKGPPKANKDGVFSTVEEAAAYSGLTKKEAGPKDLVEPERLPDTLFNPALGAGMTAKEKDELYGKLDPAITAMIPGGVSQRWQPPNMWEMIRSALNPGGGPDGSGVAGGAGGGGGGATGTERMMNAMMMMQVMQMMNNMSQSGGGMMGGGIGSVPGTGGMMPGGVAAPIVPQYITGGLDARGNPVGSSQSDPQAELAKFKRLMRKKGIQL